MKETYFQANNIEQKAREIYQSILPYTKREAEAFSPRCSALLVLDMEKYFLQVSSHAYVPSSPAIIPRINALIKAYVEASLPIVYTRHVNTLANAASMKTWWRDLITSDNPLSALSSEFDPSDGLVVEKSQYDAFFNTPLDDNLRELDTRQLVVSGVMTNLCCETTARSAFMRGYEVFIPVDATATYNLAFHQASLLNLSHGFAVPVLVAQILEKMRGINER